MSTSAISALTTTILVPAGTSTVRPASSMPFSALARTESSALTASAPTTAPQRLVDPADDEHGERDERQVEVDGVDVDREEVDVEPAREPREEAG